MSLREFKWYLLFGFQIPAIENTRYYREFNRGIQYTGCSERQESSFWFQSNKTIYLLFILTTCFGQLTIIRPSLQNLESGGCSEIRSNVIWDPISLINILKYIKNNIK
jgi:hypothetical protein